MMSYRKVFSLALFALILTSLISSQWLQASSENEIVLDEETFEAYRKWSMQASGGEKNNHNHGTLRDDVPGLSEILPGMSLQTQWLNPTLKLLMIRRMKNIQYGLSKSKEIEERWILLEEKLILIPPDIQRISKSVHFVRAATSLGTKAYKQMAVEQSVKVKELSSKEGLPFFFNSDKKRVEMFEKINGNDATSVEVMLGKYITSKSYDNFRNRKKFASMDKKTLEKFCTWVVNDIYKKIPEPKKTRIKLMSNSKKPFSSSVKSAINNRFKINLKLADIVELLDKLAEFEDN